MSKKTPQKLNAHAKQRAEERYGISLNHDQRAEIVQMIQTNQAEFVGKESNNRTLWRVQFQDQSLNVVYDKARSSMCTVLPPNAIEFQPGGFEQPIVETKPTGVTRSAITAELSEIWKDVD